MSAEKQLSFEVVRQGASETINVAIKRLVIAGWTGRDQAAVRHHIEELAERGVKAPETTPVFYRVSAARLTRAEIIDVPGQGNSGEVEFVLFQHDGELYVSVGSDHTENNVEAYGVTVAKQMCEKPVATRAWPFTEVASHWDQIHLRAWVVENGERTLYQQGQVSAMLDPAALLDGLAEVEEAFSDGKRYLRRHRAAPICAAAGGRDG